MKTFCSLVFLIFMTPLATAEVIEKIVAIVNDSAITQSDVQTFKKKINDGGLVDDALLKMKDPKTLVKDDKALVQHLIDERIIDSEIKRLGMSVTIEKVEQEIRSITSRNGISRDQLKAALKERGVAFSDYQDFIKTSLERQALIDREVSSKIKVSDDDISNFFLATNKGSSGRIFEWRLAHILVQDNPVGGVPAKQRMLNIVNRLESGKEDFAKLASQYSEDPNFSQGGLLGTFKAGEMLKEIEAGINNLNEGQTSSVIKTRLGYHIIKVLKKTLVSDPALDAQRNAIYSQLFSQAFEKQFRKWLDRKRDDAFIRIN